MRDSISEPRVDLVHPKIRTQVKELIEIAENKLPFAAVRVVQGLRTFPEQDALYKLGRTVKNPDGYDPVKRPLGNIVTNSKAGQSYHNYGFAIDFALLYDKDHNGTFEAMSWDTLKDMDKDGEADWMEVVDTFENAGYIWGGRFHSIVDQPHLEKAMGYNWKQLLIKYNNKEFIPGTTYVTI